MDAIARNRFSALAGTSAILLTSVWLTSASQAKTDPISYLRYPITKIKTFQVGDRATANLSQLAFSEDSEVLSATASHIGEALEERSTRRAGKLYINSLAVSDRELASPVVKADEYQHRFITVGQATDEQALILNVWTRDTASRPDRSMPMLLSSQLTFEDISLAKVDLSADSKHFVLAGEKLEKPIILVGDVTSNQVAHTLEAKSSITAIAFSPNDQTFATAHKNNAVYLWDIATGQQLRSLSYKAMSPPRNQWKSQLAFSTDGTLVAFGDAAGIHLWQIESGNLLCQFTLKNEVNTNVWTDTNSLAISPNNKWIASDAGHSGKLYIWSAQTGDMQRILRTHTPALAAFSPDNKLLATGDSYGKVSLWHLPERFAVSKQY